MNLPCQVCKKNIATEAHHLLPQRKMYKKLYPDYIHDSRNLMYVCHDCHQFKGVPSITEKEFCDIMGIEIRSKVGK